MTNRRKIKKAAIKYLSQQLNNQAFVTDVANIAKYRATDIVWLNIWYPRLFILIGNTISNQPVPEYWIPIEQRNISIKWIKPQ